MNRRRIILTLAMLFVAGLFLTGFGTWLWMITNYTRGWEYTVKPYGPMGLALVIFGTFLLVVAIGLLFDLYQLLMTGRASRMNRAIMVLILVTGSNFGLFLIGFGNWLYEFTRTRYVLDAMLFPVKIEVQPYWTEGLGLVICGVLVLAAVSILLVDWTRLLIRRRTARALLCSSLVFYGF